MSRGYEARRKAKRRREAREAAQSGGGNRRLAPRLLALLPAAVILTALLAVAALGISAGAGSDRKEVQRRVAALLKDVPQNGTTLGSPSAPITLFVFADVQCPTVKLFVEKHLPSLIDTWVRDGWVKLEYRSLRTDTSDERAFYQQEIAALAAGRQDRMWNYVLTFVHEQGEAQSNYATDEFLVDIASQVPGLSRKRWQHDRDEASLSKQVARVLRSANTRELRSTPSFLLRFREKDGGSPLLNGANSATEGVEASLKATVTALREEDFGDVPTVGVLGVQ